MSEWKETIWGECISVSSGEGLSERKMKPGPYLVYGGNGVTGLHDDYLYEQEKLIIGRVGAHCGNVHITKSKSWITDNALIVSFLQNEDDLRFWFYLLSNSNLRLHAFESAQPVITGGIINKIKVTIPAPKTQRQIATILSTADAVIEKTQAAIAKYKAIKQGMLQDLFTRGIDTATGKLRPSYQDAPELYKESALGWVPREWEVEEIKSLVKANVLDDIQDGNHGEIHPKSNDFVSVGIPFVMASDISNDMIDFDNCHKISREQYLNLRIGFSKADDILLSHKASIGFVARVPSNIHEVMLTPQVTYYRVLNKNILRPDYLEYFLRSDLFQVPLHTLGKQSTRDYIGITMQKNLRIAYPKNIDEQNLISEKLISIYNKLQTEQDFLHKQQQIKAGLMGDLLSGRVEVIIKEKL